LSSSGLVSQRPGQRHLRQRLAAPLGDGVELTGALKVLWREHRFLEKAILRGTAAGGHAGQIFVGQQALRERGKDDRADALGFERVQKMIVLDPAIDHRITGLVDETGRAEALEDGGRFFRADRIVGRDTGVKRFPLANRMIESAHRFLERRLGIETVRIEDVDVIEPHALEALIEARKHVFAAAPFAVRPRPHIIAGLGRDHEFVAKAAEVAAQDVAEGKLG
jgi:hypothetical protein